MDMLELRGKDGCIKRLDGCPTMRTPPPNVLKSAFSAKTIERAFASCLFHASTNRARTSRIVASSFGPTGLGEAGLCNRDDWQCEAQMTAEDLSLHGEPLRFHEVVLGAEFRNMSSDRCVGPPLYRPESAPAPGEGTADSFKSRPDGFKRTLGGDLVSAQASIRSETT